MRSRPGLGWPARFWLARASDTRWVTRSSGRFIKFITWRVICSRRCCRSPPPEFPFVALLVSGGHTQLLHVGGWGNYRLLGETLDDAAGEAFDKTAQLLGLGYPGGPAVSRLAEFGDPGAITLPRPMLGSGDLNFSFSGLKTAVLTAVRRAGPGNVCEQARADIARAFVEAIVDVLAAKALRALDQTGLSTLVVAGGVGANAQLRERLQMEVVEPRRRGIFSAS